MRIISHPLYKHIPEHELWRLCVDGELQGNSEELGFIKFSAREMGSIGNYLKAYDYMLQNVSSPVSVEFIKELHRIAIEGLDVQSTSGGNPGSFRNIFAQFPLSYGRNLSAAGYKELEELPEDSPFRLNQKLMGRELKKNDREVDLRIESRTVNSNELEKLVADEIAEYYYHIQNAQTEEEKNRIILMLVSNLERIHPFNDGNCRVFCNLLLNKLRLENNLSPVVMYDPNRFDGYSIDELVVEVADGVKAFQNLSNGRMPYPDALTIEQIIEKIKSLDESEKKQVILQLICESQLEILKKLLVADPEIDLNDPITPLGNNALIIAAYTNNIEMVNFLINQIKVDLNRTGSWGGTAYFWAHHQGNRQIEQLLLDAGVKKMEVLPIEENANYFELLLKYFPNLNPGYCPIFDNNAFIYRPLTDKHIKKRLSSIISSFGDFNGIRDIVSILEFFGINSQPKETFFSPTQRTIVISPVIKNAMLFGEKIIAGIYDYIRRIPNEEIINALQLFSFDCDHGLLKRLFYCCHEKMCDVVDNICQKRTWLNDEHFWMEQFLKYAPEKKDILLDTFLKGDFNSISQIPTRERLVEYYPDRQQEIENKIRDIEGKKFLQNPR